MELHYFQSFLTGGAEGAFNPTLSHTILIPCRHNMADSMCTKTTSDCPDVPSATSGRSLSFGRPFLQHCRGRQVDLQSTSAQVLGGGQRVGIDDEALFMHPPCSSKKSVSFSLVCLSLSHRDAFCKMEIVFWRHRTHTDDGPLQNQLAGGPGEASDVKGQGVKERWEVAVQR